MIKYFRSGHYFLDIQYILNWTELKTSLVFGWQSRSYSYHMYKCAHHSVRKLITHLDFSDSKLLWVTLFLGDILEHYICYIYKCAHHSDRKLTTQLDFSDSKLLLVTLYLVDISEHYICYVCKCAHRSDRKLTTQLDFIMLGVHIEWETLPAFSTGGGPEQIISFFEFEISYTFFIWKIGRFHHKNQHSWKKLYWYSYLINLSK